MTPGSIPLFKLTKTGFKHYLDCPREFWLRYHHPEAIVEPIDAHGKFLIRQGYEVERVARKVLQNRTEAEQLDFQHTVAHENLEARFDIFQSNTDGSCAIYEIKSSKHVPAEEKSKKKREKRELNLNDLGFQVYVARLRGLSVAKAFLVTINGEYVRGKNLNPEELIHFEDATDEIEAMQNEIAAKVSDAMDVIEHGPHQSLEDLCKNKLRCPYIVYTQPDLPEVSIYDIPRINKKRISALLDIGVVDIFDVPDEADLTKAQLEFVKCAQMPGKGKIRRQEIGDFIQEIEYPLYFLDYETVNPAIPEFEGMCPFEQITFQFSLQIRETKHGVPLSQGFLADGPGDFQRDLVKNLRESIGDAGSVIVWNKSFEQSQNRLLARLYPEFAAFLQSLNERMVDLAVPFQTGLYRDPAIKGWSIKTVLPAVAPEMSYDGLAIDGGALASGYWYMDVFKGSEEKERRMAELLEYCAQDTMAMVRILDVLSDLVGE